MRYLIIIWIVIHSACNIKNDNSVSAQPVNQDSLVNELVKNDFLMYTDSSEIDSLRQSFISNGYIFSLEINRYVHIDAEELVEGSFDFFRSDLTRIINKRGLKITFSKTDTFEKLHEVMVNDKTFVLYDEKNLEDYSFWDIGPRRFFEKINHELEKSKSKERFYLLYSGNDLGAILLTEKQFAIIEKLNEGNTKEIPYKP